MPAWCFATLADALVTAGPDGRCLAMATATSPGPVRGSGSLRSDDDPDDTRIRALVTLAQAGDAEAFGQIYEQYVDVVYRYVYVRVGSTQLAEDLTSETFLRALRRLDSFAWQGRDIAAWFVTIARNLITDHRKSSRFRLEVTTDELVGMESPDRRSPTGAAAAPCPEDVVIDRARDERLVEALRRLRPEQQECLVLRFFQEFSVAETAKAMGRSEGAVKQLQLRACRALAGVLGGERP